MASRKTRAVILTWTALVSIELFAGQIRFVQILKFEVDGKQHNEKFMIFLKLDDKLKEPLRFENGFVVPEEVSADEKFDARLIFGKYDLYFESIHASAFDTNWIVGVDEAPFDPDNLETPVPAGKKLKLVYWIQFVPRHGEETRLVVRVYK